MMQDDQTEMMEGDDYMNDDDHRDGDQEKMQDTTSMEMDKVDEDMMQ